MTKVNFRFKKIALFFVLITSVLIGTSYGKTVTIEINANSEDVEGKIETSRQLDEATLIAGIGAVYIEDSFTFLKLNFGLQDNLFSPALTLGLGFNLMVGEGEKNTEDYDLGAVSFSIFGAYDLREITTIPATFSASLSMAPDPLCFMDTEEYLEFNAGVSFYIVKSSSVYLGYKKIKADFDGAFDTVKQSDDSVFFGFKLTF
jgi:hypothetical protein